MSSDWYVRQIRFNKLTLLKVAILRLNKMAAMYTEHMTAIEAKIAQR
ncbi:MAG: hypothetical protein SH848_17480 [Saprospiraceae bacterium]|nr:hypothetical protein [Saprospiraceae bacterium]MDZ4705723.1 hypothetical protein [Saprospiraceae bacterium]